MGVRGSAQRHGDHAGTSHATVVARVQVSQGERAPVWPAWSPPSGAVVAWLELQAAVRAHQGWLACELDPEVWFATRATPALAAAQDRAVEECGRCPLRELCAAYAMAAGERDGIWGGLTPGERRSP